MFRSLVCCAPLTLALLLDVGACVAADVQSKLATPVLFISSQTSLESDAGIRLRGLLDGLGIPYRHQLIDRLETLRPQQYQVLVVLPGFLHGLQQRMWLNASLKRALANGVNVIYIGTSFCENADSELQRLFAVSFDPVSCLVTVSEQSGRQFAVDSLGLPGRTLMLVAGELMLRRHDAAVVDQPWFVRPSDHLGHGEAILLGFDVMAFWKYPLTTSSYLRPLLLTRLLNRCLADGYVAKHAAMHALQSPLLMRWEDVAPLSEQSPQRPLIQHLDQFERILDAHQLPLNIALVSRYIDPSRQLDIRWSDRNAANEHLKRFIGARLELGGSLIAHGYTHQSGSGSDDISNHDHEMWDEDQQVYLSRRDQLVRILAAMQDVHRDWGRRPLIWETPHYQSNHDTYSAVAEAGFEAVVESDSSLFPNRYGYAGKLDSRLLNIPETGYEMPWSKQQIQQRLHLWRHAIQPDLNELGAPFLFFHHGHTRLQLEALAELLDQSERFRYWKPSLNEYVSFWNKRREFVFHVSRTHALSRFSIRIERGFEGMTMRVRLPNGQEPERVLVDSVPIRFLSRRFDGHDYIYISLPSRNSRSIEVAYRPRS